MTIEKQTRHLSISHGSAHGIIQGQLGFPKVYARWAPKQLTRKHKRNRLTIYPDPLNRYRKGDASFLRLTVIGDETWIHHDAPESDIASLKDVQNSTIGKQCEVDILVGCTRANFGTIPREGYDSKQCTL
jgi:hypothetical protein